jgi:hypothetical protein
LDADSENLLDEHNQDTQKIIVLKADPTEELYEYPTQSLI